MDNWRRSIRFCETLILQNFDLAKHGMLQPQRRDSRPSRSDRGVGTGPEDFGSGGSDKPFRIHVFSTFVTPSCPFEGVILAVILPLFLKPIARFQGAMRLIREAMVNGDDVWPVRNSE